MGMHAGMRRHLSKLDLMSTESCLTMLQRPLGEIDAPFRECFAFKRDAHLSALRL